MYVYIYIYQKKSLWALPSCTNYGPKMIVELHFQFCTNFNTQLQGNPSPNGSRAPGLFLYPFPDEFIHKSVHKWLWSSRSISLSISIQIHKEICPKSALDLQVHFCITFNINS